MYGFLYMNVSVLENKELFDKGLSLVSKERKAKVLKLKNPAAARLSLGAGLLLRIALVYSGIEDQLENISYGEHGKPYLKDSNFHFSLSHSGEYAICAYGDAPLGADLQLIKGFMPNHTKKILSESEENYLKSLDDKNKSEVFYQIWSKKESLIKWDGRGLRIPLSELNTVIENNMANMVLFECKECIFQELDLLMPEYAISICSEKRIIWNHIIEVTSNFLIKY